MNYLVISTHGGEKERQESLKKIIYSNGRFIGKLWKGYKSNILLILFSL